jgi:hypothetical protein
MLLIDKQYSGDMFLIIMANTPTVWWSYWFLKNSIFVVDLYQDFNEWTVLIERPNRLTSKFADYVDLTQI